MIVRNAHIFLDSGSEVLPIKSCIRHAALTLLVIAALTLTFSALAQSSAGKDRIGSWYIGGGFGAYAEEDNSQLSSQDAGGALFFSAGYRASSNVALEADFLGWNQDFLTPTSISPGILSSADAGTDLESSGLGAVIKFIAPLNVLDLYGGVGVGYYLVNLSVNGSGGGVDETERELGYQLLFGADVYVSRKISLGLEYRWLELEANFEPYIAGAIDAGGQFLLVNIRGHF
ncbi:MAG: porin family protein [Betaproteobacteria bacterium]|nr:MAG: porin family protein [Betaproteobacteria bacterium]